MPEQALEGKVAVVGAGAKNLGGLISRTLGAEGASVVVHYNSDATKASAEDTVATIAKGGSQAFAVQGDLTKVSEVVRLFDEAIRRFGRLDVAVNTVGKVLKKPFVETTEAEYDSMFAVNSKAAYFFIQEAGKRMNDGGKIVTVVTSLLAAFTGLYSTYAGKGPGGTLYARGGEGIRFARDFRQQRCARADGHALFLPGRIARVGRIPQGGEHERQADRHQRHRADC